MYNEFLFFYEKEPYKQFIWRYMGQTTAAKEYVFPLLRISNHKWLKDYFRHVAL